MGEGTFVEEADGVLLVLDELLERLVPLVDGELLELVAALDLLAVVAQAKG